MENPKIHENTYKNRVAEFEQQQKQQPCSITQKVQPKVAKCNPKNPYLLAREKVMAGLPDWRRTEVLGMEARGDLDNSHYYQFVKMVAEEGDKLT